MIFPALGGCAPAMRLNMVVLPAPFGPMMPKISRSFTSKVTSRTAARPPKNFVSPSTCSSGPLLDAAGTYPPCEFAHSTKYSARFEQDDHDQHGAVDQQVHVGELGNHFFFHEPEHHSA